MIRIVRNVQNGDSCIKCYYGEYNGEKCNNEDCNAPSGYHYKDEKFDEKETELINNYIDKIKKDRKKLKLIVLPSSDCGAGKLILDYGGYTVFSIKDNTLYLNNVNKYEEWVNDGMLFDDSFIYYGGTEWSFSLNGRALFLCVGGKSLVYIINLTTLETYHNWKYTNLKHHPVTKNIYLR